jgi:very-short-patch-repair endonuclease
VYTPKIRDTPLGELGIDAHVKTWDAITELAERTHGVVAAKQILASGGSWDWIRWAVRDGRLHRLRHGVYAIRGAASTYQDLMAACLAAGPSAGASHLAAAEVWGAEQIKRGLLELTTFDRRRTALPGVATHQSRLPSTEVLTTRFNIPIVIPALTVVQVADRAHPRLVKSVANDLVKRNWTSFQKILEWSIRVGGGGQGQEALRQMCRRAVDLGGHSDSPAARTLGERLKAAGVAPFEMDYPVETRYGVFLLDFAWPHPKLGLEYNGARDHDNPVAKRDDARRRAGLVEAGWRVYDANAAVTYTEVLEWVMAALG